MKRLCPRMNTFKAVVFRVVYIVVFRVVFGVVYIVVFKVVKLEVKEYSLRTDRSIKQRKVCQMEIKYTNAPWVQFQIHPSTYQTIKMCARLYGQSPEAYLRESIESSVRGSLSQVYESDREAESIFPRARLFMSEICI